MSLEVTIASLGSTNIVIETPGAETEITLRSNSATELEIVGGPPGSRGPAGPPNSLDIGTVTTSAAGSNATAEITGEAPAQTLNLVLPRGEAGPPTSLDIGTVETGDPGSDATAEITGEAPTQTLNLVLPRGEAGPPNVISIGDVVTGPAGSDAEAEVTGSPPAQVLHLTIPRGDPGQLTDLAIGDVTTGAPGSAAQATITGAAPAKVLNLVLPRGATGPVASADTMPVTPAGTIQSTNVQAALYELDSEKAPIANPTVTALTVAGSVPAASNRYAIININGLALKGAAYLGWGSNANDAGGTPDVQLARASAGNLRLSSDGISGIANFTLTGSITAGGVLVLGGTANLSMGNVASAGLVNTGIVGDSTNAYLSFKTSGSERVRIANTGNVGIGTTSPGAKLEIAGGTSGASFSALSLFHSAFADADTTDAISIDFKFQDTVNNPLLAAQIVAGKLESYENPSLRTSYLAFSTELDDVLAERVRITSTGLAVTGNAAVSGSVSTLYVDTTFGINCSGADMAVYSTANNAGIIRFITQAGGAQQERLRIANNGNVGIGVTAPTQKLDVEGNARFATLGAELVTNGAFASDTAWTKGTGVTISGGVANASGGAAGYSDIVSQPIPSLVAGKRYRVSFTLTVSQGWVQTFLGASGDTTVQYVGNLNASGTFTYEVTATSVNTFRLRDDGSRAERFVGSIDNVSVKEVRSVALTDGAIAASGNLEARGDVSLSHKITGWTPTRHVALDFIEATNDPSLFIGRDAQSGSATGYPFTNINIGGYGHQSLYALNVASNKVQVNRQLVINQPQAASTSGNSGGSMRIIRNQGSGNFAFGIDGADKAYIQNWFGADYFDLLLNPQGGKVELSGGKVVAAPTGLAVTGTISASGSISGSGATITNSAGGELLTIYASASLQYPHLRLVNNVSSARIMLKPDAKLSLEDGGLDVGGPIKAGNKTIAQFPAAATAGAGAQLFVTDGTRPNRPVYSDGAAWRYFSDDAVVS